jgi:hypothetical protein
MHFVSSFARNKQPAPAWLSICICLAFVATSMGFTGQTPPDENTWSAVVNLSNSGSASSPIIVPGPDGITHVAWYDQFLGNRYTQSADGVVWSAPQTLQLPFGEIPPRLINSPLNFTFAYWLSGNGNLYSSRVAQKNFGIPGSWDRPVLIARNVVSYDVTIDAEGISRLAFITSRDVVPNQPAGVYYIQSLPGVNKYGLAKVTFASPYFRGLNPADAPHISVARVISGETKEVLLAWDDPSQGRIQITRSIDEGKTWEAPAFLDQSNASIGSSASHILDIVDFQDNLILVWSLGASTAGCQIFYQTATGLGQDWTASQELLGKTLGCPTQLEVLGKNADALLMQATLGNQVYLVAWNGQQWSIPQAQAALSGIHDPNTSRTLNAGCRQFAFQPEQNRLEVVSCDLDGNKDIWYSSMLLGSTAGWFSATSSWNTPQQLNSVPWGLDGLNLVAGEDGKVYALWAQPSVAGVTAALNTTQPNLMYAEWDDESWSQPATVMRMRGLAHQLRVTIDRSGNLLAVWRGENPGQIIFSRAPAAAAFSGIEWAEPVILPTPGGPCISPVVLTGEENEVFVAYVMPANEGRGVYINRSLDDGRTWAEAVRVFDAQSAGWQLVDQPVLALTKDGRLHALWQQRSLLNAYQGSGLGYAVSDDRGSTWSAPDLSIESKIRWAGMVASSQGPLFRVWHEINSGLIVVATQISADGGKSWQEQASIAASGELVGNPKLVEDTYGEIHLLQMTRNTTGDLVLLHWIWINNTWAAGESLNIGKSDPRSTSEITGVVTSQESLAVLFTANDTITGNQTLNAVLGTTRQAGELALTSTAPTPTSGPEPTPEGASPSATPAVPEQASPTVEASPTAEPTALPTSTPDFTAGGNIPSSSGLSTWIGLMIGSVLAIAIVAVIFGIRIYRSRARNFRRRNYPK